MDNLEQVISLFLPEGLLDLFEIVNVATDNETHINIWLDERHIPPQSTETTYFSKGFTPVSVIQDFPVRGKALFLHIRRRKWLDLKTNQIISNTFDLTHLGTRMSKEFTAFLKGTNRE